LGNLVSLFSDLVNVAILFSIRPCGVFSINFKKALPTITASAPTETYFFTSDGVETPKPTPTGIVPFVCFFTSFSASASAFSCFSSSSCFNFSAVSIFFFFVSVIDFSAFFEGQDLGDYGEIYALMGTVLYPSISATTIISYGVAAVVIGGLAALIPAWQASRREPAESLHHV